VFFIVGFIINKAVLYWFF